MRYGSVCSGIESASVGWEPLGWGPAWLSEIEPFPCVVLAHRYPHVANLGDMTYLPELVRGGLVEAPDILVGGTPCQAFSVAGKQGSLADERGGLSLIYGDLLNAIDEQRPGNESIAVWENVPGVLSTKDNAFGHLLGLLAGEFTLADCLSGRAEPLEAQPGASSQKWSKSGCVIGPKRTIAWRVIDAQYFGLAQRRKRVFLVASARDGFDPAAVLFERESVRRDIAPSRETQEETTECIAHSVGALCARTCQSISVQDASQGHLLPATYQEVVNCLQTTCDDYSRADGFNMVFGIPGNWIGRKPENGGNAVEPMNNISPCLTMTDRHAVANRRVRRLTPTECERLQGFPDNYTNVPYRNKPAADGPRYKALGNSKATNCVQWLGVRIQLHLWGLI